jgi:exopolyphosphatase/guanosine-5'-triphosphate,3'-diphosphate pyrophosphatase
LKVKKIFLSLPLPKFFSLNKDLNLGLKKLKKTKKTNAMIKKLKKKLLFLILLTPITLFSQDSNVYAGLEVSAKSIKVSILELTDIKKGNYNILDTWSENVNVGKNISISGTINPKDIATTTISLKENYEKLKITKGIDPSRIFVVISSGVSIAKNTNELISAIEKEIAITPKTITVDEETKLLLQGSLPPDEMDESILLDVGGGNTRGGFLTKLKVKDSYFYSPITLKYGTVTLTEKIKNAVKIKDDYNEYIKVNSLYNDTINKTFKDILKTNRLFQEKEKIVLSGGAIWALATLVKSTTEEKKKAAVTFTIQDVKNYHLDLITNFSKFEKLAENNEEAKKVLSTYSQLYLISGNSILLAFLNSIDNVDKKTLTFQDQGYVAWLKAYILENVKGKKDIY